MAVLSRSALRQRVASAIAALSGYDESRVPAGRSFREPSERRHGVFTVSAGPTIPGTRQRSGNVHVETSIGVAISWKVKPKDQIASMDAGLDAQEAVSVAVLGMSLTDTQINLERISEPVFDGDGEWLRLDLSFLAVHLCAVV